MLEPSEQIAPAWNARAVVTFAGQFDTHIKTGEDYPALALADLWTLKPARQPKGAGPAILASTYHDFDAREHAAQRERGQFVLLAGDVDSGNHELDAIKRAVAAFAPKTACLIYASAHARPGDLRWRILFPLAEPLPFDTWHDAQTAFFAFMEARGIAMDHSLARAAQPIYLPNVPDVHGKSGTSLRGEDGEPLFYVAARTPMAWPGLHLTQGAIADGIAALRARRAEDERERERIRREAEAKRAATPRGDGASVMDDFNAANTVATMLELCGYEQSPRHAEDWRSPYQTSESYATRVIGSKWVSLSASDSAAGLGTRCQSGCFGDAYDLFVHFKHGGDHKAAYRQLGAERRAANGNVIYPRQFETPEVPDWMMEAPGYDEAPDWLDGEPVFDEPEGVAVQASDTFQILDLDELENLPSPEWLVKELVVDDGLTVIFGDPGAGKSFIALDMALRLSLAMDWHGTETKQVGVLYIAGEGARGLGKRVKGWRREHGKQGAEAPFMLLPVPVALLDPEQRAKLLRTIDEAIRRAGFAIGLVVIDTVSRSLAGAGENGADEMGAFVSACDIVRAHIGGAVLGVHHSGKDKEKGMRGSTVLLGACDGVIRVSKDGELVTLKTEKQKDAEESAPIHMRMKKVSWPIEGDEWQSTLVPFLTADRPAVREEMNNEQVAQAFEILSKAWNAGRPLSTAPQVRGQGRYAPSVISKGIGCSEKLVSEYLTNWLENQCIAIEVFDTDSKVKGLRVINSIVPGVSK
jgi:hypothetical protein